MSKRKAYIKTFGCQMNVHDSEKMAGILQQDGYEITNDRKEADVIIYNTCSIREKAEQKFLSDLGRLRDAKKTRPELKIAVAGCIAQQMGRSLKKKNPFVDYILGPQNIHSISGMLRQEGSPADLAIDENPDATLLELPASRKSGYQAWVSIMYGCNNYCTYCIVPYTRGRETSRASTNIINELKMLVSQGFKEVTLLGQNVNSYQSDTDFTGLLYEAGRVRGLERLRFVTNHPKNLSQDLALAMGEISTVCEHIHLPLQSGSNRVLSDMNRKYTLEQYLEKIHHLREAMPDIAITSDIIAGFPGETEAEHNETVSALKLIEFDGIFAFRYSPRPGTPASSIKEQLPEELKLRRLREILEVQDQITLKKNKSLEGQVLEVLVDEAQENGATMQRGRTRTNKIVNFPGDSSLQGRLLDIRIVQGNKHSLVGEVYPLTP